MGQPEGVQRESANPESAHPTTSPSMLWTVFGISTLASMIQILGIIEVGDTFWIAIAATCMLAIIAIFSGRIAKRLQYFLLVVILAGTAVSAVVVSLTSFGVIELECGLPASVAQRGSALQVDFTVRTTKERRVGLGAAVRASADGDDEDRSTGDGDVDSMLIEKGALRSWRTVNLSSDLPKGNYEIALELWPENQIGADEVETLADLNCGSIDVR